MSSPVRRRNRKRDRPRSKTIAKRKCLTRQERLEADRLRDFAWEPHPACRGDCRDASRPCTFIACRHHLYVGVGAKGSLTINFPDLEVWELPETCALDVAECGACSLEEVGDVMNLSRERVRQIEESALDNLFGVIRREA